MIKGLVSHIKGFGFYSITKGNHGKFKQRGEKGLS